MELFRDNWSYLKVEINWLERILLTAAAKMRKTEAITTRFAKTKGDRATHSWWEGLVSLEKVGYDSPPTPSAPRSTLSYQQQLDLRIAASHAQGISLALPTLCDRYSLSLFEKQTILLAMAPEVHRRYGELCGYLTGHDTVSLPNVDLALRLFCRDDQAWRHGRSQLQGGTLIEQTILIPSDSRHQSFLESPLKLSPHIVSALLGDQPTVGNASRNEHHFVITPARPSPINPSDMDPSPDFLAQFQHALQTLQLATSQPIKSQIVNPQQLAQVAQWVGLDRSLSSHEKINLYHHLAEALNLSIAILDLSTLTDAYQAQILQPIPLTQNSTQNSTQNLVPPTLLVITSAQRWLSRSGTLNRSQIHQLIQILQSQYTWIIFDYPYPIAMGQIWRSWIRIRLEKNRTQARKTQSKKSTDVEHTDH